MEMTVIVGAVIIAVGFLEQLQQHAGRLRCEVAASINRRKVPTLVFPVVNVAAVERVAPA